MATQRLENAPHHVDIGKGLAAAQVVCLVVGFNSVQAMQVGDGQVVRIHRLPQAAAGAEQGEKTEPANQARDVGHIAVAAVATIDQRRPQNRPCDAESLAFGSHLVFCGDEPADDLQFAGAGGRPLGEATGRAECNEAPHAACAEFLEPVRKQPEAGGVNQCIGLDTSQIGGRIGQIEVAPRITE